MVVWRLDGESFSSDPENVSVVFEETGTYSVDLIAFNDLGCTDTTTQEILINIPIVDLSVGRFELIDNGGTGSIFLEIQNKSNLPIDQTEVVIELENQFSVTEQITELIGIGESQLVNLNVGVPLSVTELSFLCVSLNSQYQGYDDLNPIDNEKCINIQPRVTVEAPYPNPVEEELRVKLIVPANGDASVTLISPSGGVEFKTSRTMEEGLNNLFVNVRSLPSGIHFLKIEIAGTTSIQRTVKL